MPAEDRSDASPDPGPSRLRRFIPLAVLVILALLAFATGWHRELSLETLVRYRSVLDGFVREHGATAIAAFVAVYIVSVALSIPGGLFLTIASGVMFGTFVGGLASMTGATIGATILFLVAKTAFGEHLLRRAGPLAVRLANDFQENAFSYLLFLRLVPFPFFMINLVAALVGMRLGTFVAATAVGIVPAVFALTFLGAGLDSVIVAQETTYRSCLAAGGTNCTLDFNLKTAITPELLAALVALGCAALVPVVVKRLRARRAGNPAS